VKIQFNFTLRDRACALIRLWRSGGRPVWLLLFGLVLAVVAISCATGTQTVVVPPQIPGAEFVGSKSCEECHANTVRDFHTATHAGLKALGENAKDIGCESCHGAGSVHNQSGGAAHTIINPRKSPEVCFQCHLDKRGQFNLPYHHPVLEGKISCGDCHDPHKGPAIRGGGTALLTEHQTCGQCHTAQAGPFVFEHEAVREGCTTCHAGVVHDHPIKGYPIVVPRGHVSADTKTWNPDYPEGSYLRARALEDCFRCHDGKSQHQGKVVDRKCETCHLPEKIKDFLSF